MKMAKVEIFIKVFSLITVLHCGNNICSVSSEESGQVAVVEQQQQQQQQRMLNKSSSNLSSMKLKELETLNNWQIIDLSHNSIEFIDSPELLEKQNELDFLQIDFNAKFKPKENRAIFTNKNLKRMSCKGCGFTEIQSQHFTGFDILAELDLSANKINKIAADAFKRNGYLRRLDISENQIISLLPATFSPFRKFEELIISSNPIQLPLNKPFIKSESLKRLIMTNCNIADIYKETFNELKSIEAINLNDNRIEKIAVTTFALNPKLKSLFIENNHLKFFPASILDSSKELDELCADNNTYSDTQEFKEFIKRYETRRLRTSNCSQDVENFIESLFKSNDEIIINPDNSTDEKSSKFIKFNEGISQFFIGSYLTIILIMQAAAAVLLTLYLIKITKYEKLGTGTDVNYANTILNDNDIYKVYKLNE
ncbi:phospholipase A2 inhibitor-like [Chironomus tepperi]|uniref:phospholipase A2 inhibitor-like n=1 Tax=Chironomus tepperi TaxID=113505 RepID=UPI00391F1078